MTISVSCSVSVLMFYGTLLHVQNHAQWHLLHAAIHMCPVQMYIFCIRIYTYLIHRLLLSMYIHGYLQAEQYSWPVCLLVSIYKSAQMKREREIEKKRICRYTTGDIFTVFLCNFHFSVSFSAFLLLHRLLSVSEQNTIFGNHPDKCFLLISLCTQSFN